MTAVAITGLFLFVALLAFHVGRTAGRVEAAHAAVLSRQLHPGPGRDIVDQPAGEHVRIVPDDDDTPAVPYDWDAGNDEGDTERAAD